MSPSLNTFPTISLNLFIDCIIHAKLESKNIYFIFGEKLISIP